MAKLLLELAKKLFEDQTSLDRMVTKIMMEATELVKCERCTVLLLDTKNKVNALFTTWPDKRCLQDLTFSSMFTGGGTNYRR